MPQATTATRIGLWLVALLVCVYYDWHSLRVVNDLTAFVANGDDPQKAQVIRALATSPASRVLTVLIEAKHNDKTDATASLALSQAIATDVAKLADIAWIRHGTDEHEPQALFELYRQSALAMTSIEPEQEILALADPAVLDKKLQDLRNELAKPSGVWVKRVAPEDPLLTVVKRLDQLGRAQAGALQLESNQLRTAAGAGVLFIATQASAFDGASQGRVAHALAQAMATHGASWRERGYQTNVYQSGIAPYALASEAAIRRDVSRISVVSSLALIGAVLVLFASLRALVAMALPVVSAIVVALALSQLMWGEVQGLTLAFGATLIGITIDYPLHVYCHSVWGTSASAVSRRHLWIALSLGAITTLVGFGGLAFTSFPGMQQIATFTSAGLVVALLVSIAIVPCLVRPRPSPPRLAQALARALMRMVSAVQRHPRRAWGLAALMATPGLLGLTQLRFDDHPAALSPRDPHIAAQDEWVRREIGAGENSRLLVAQGASREAALAVNDRLYTEWRRAHQGSDSPAPRSLHDFVWSQNLQARNLAAWRTLARRNDWSALWRDAVQRAGFQPTAFLPFEASLTALAASDVDPPTAYLTLDKVATTSLGTVIRAFEMPMPTGFAVVTFLAPGAETSIPSLVDLAARVPGAAWLDQGEILRSIYAANRSTTLRVCLAGLVAVWLVLWLRYRNVWLATSALLPALVAGAAALGSAAWLGFSLNLFHVVCLVLVLSMGVDYSIFLVEAQVVDQAQAGSEAGPFDQANHVNEARYFNEIDHAREAESSVVSVTLSCLSTVLSLGLLAWSSQPLLRSIGMVVGLGVAMAWLLSPLALTLRSKATKAPAFHQNGAPC